MAKSEVVRKARALAAHGIRLLKGSSDQFERFQDSIKVSTWKAHDSILEWATDRADREEANSQWISNDRLVTKGWTLKKSVEDSFRAKHANLGKTLRILVHVPSFEISPGGFSLFNNMISAFNFLGIPSEALEWEEPIEAALKRFNPSCFMTSDHTLYLGKIDWPSLVLWKKRNGLLLGLTASLQGDGISALESRLSWARRNAVDFYYSFHSSEYLHECKEYGAFFEAGYQIFSVEFGANALQYYPVERTEEDLAYVFLASSNPEKRERYIRFLRPIVKKYTGFIDGPGWKKLSVHAPARTHRYLYSRARVGINLHIQSSIDWPSELNERTYILAACGVPQVVDNAKLLPRRFSPGCFSVASTPAEYLDAFVYALKEPEAARHRAELAMEEVFTRYTTFHRADSLVLKLASAFHVPTVG